MTILNVEQACEILAAGGVIAYPTEAVYGLGCDPRVPRALDRLLALKARDGDKGLILIAADESQLSGWLGPNGDEELTRARPSWPGPVTWVMTAAPEIQPPVARPDGSLGIRISAHPVCRALCRQFGSPLVSTSANPSGELPARTAQEVSVYFDQRLDGIVAGECGGRERPTEIRDARTGAILRKA